MHFFVCGTHTCGKTSIIKRLVAEGVIKFGGDEIGKRLHYQRTVQTDKCDSDFEAEVTQMESLRDHEVITHYSGKPVVLETWHPGNLAYAMKRTPAAASSIIKAYESSPLRDSIRGIWLHLSTPEKTIAERTQTFKDDPDFAVSFYSPMQGLIGDALHAMGLIDRTIKISADGTQEEVYQAVKQVVLQAQGA